MIRRLAGRLRDDLVGAAMVLTRLPVGALARRGWTGGLSGGVWAYPLVGALAGLLGGAAGALGLWLGLPGGLAAAWALAALLLLTGALHEDGLADTADGFGGGRGRARKLEIMRDSRIGSYGVLALALSLGIRGLALAAMPGPWAMVASLVVSGALGRGAILGVLALAPPARPDGLAALLGRPSAGLLAGGLALAALPALLLLPLPVALGGILLTGLCALGMARLACRQVGGHTGDVLGACEQLAEAVVLSLLAASLGHWAGPG